MEWNVKVLSTSSLITNLCMDLRLKLYRKAAGNLTTINCPPNMARYEDGEALSEITTAFATNHDVWNEEFLAGWEKFVENGYGEDELVTGPEYSWLGYSHFGGWTDSGNICLSRF